MPQHGHRFRGPPPPRRFIAAPLPPPAAVPAGPPRAAAGGRTRSAERGRAGAPRRQRRGAAAGGAGSVPHVQGRALRRGALRLAGGRQRLWRSGSGLAAAAWPRGALKRDGDWLLAAREPLPALSAAYQGRVWTRLASHWRAERRCRQAASRLGDRRRGPSPHAPPCRLPRFPPRLGCGGCGVRAGGAGAACRRSVSVRAAHSLAGSLVLCPEARCLAPGDGGSVWSRSAGAGT